MGEVIAHRKKGNIQMTQLLVALYSVMSAGALVEVQMCERNRQRKTV
jgi:hypothetical protein